jgi:hypothetical protein
MVSISDSVETIQSPCPALVDTMTTLFVFVDDYLKCHPKLAGWRRSPNAFPRFTDAEVITIALMQGCLGCATLKQAYSFVAGNCRREFPNLCCYAQWISRLNALCGIVGRLIQEALGVSGLPEHRLYITDGKPIPVCKPIRHGRVRLLHEDGAYFGKGSTGWFFGFRLHLLVHESGAILNAMLTPGNLSEKDVTLALCLAVDGGILLADLGYRSKDGELDRDLAEEADMLIIRPNDAGNKTDPRRALVSSLRERVETTIARLWDRFVDRVYSRSWNGLWCAIRIKMLHFNLCQQGLIA